MDTYIQRYSHLNKERRKHIGPIQEQSSMHPHSLHAMVKSGPAWFLVFTSLFKGLYLWIYRSPNEMGVGGGRQNAIQKLSLTSRLNGLDLLWFILWMYHFLYSPCIRPISTLVKEKPSPYTLRNMAPSLVFSQSGLGEKFCRIFPVYNIYLQI